MAGRPSIAWICGSQSGRSAVFAGGISIVQGEDLGEALRAAVRAGWFERGVGNDVGHNSGDQ